MAWQSGAGTSIAISLAAPATFDATGYGALTPKIIGEVTSAPDLKKVYAEVSHQPLAERGTDFRKGSWAYQSSDISMALDESDLGQIDVATAALSDDPAYFAITYQDGTVYWMEALVMSYGPDAVGSVDDVVTSTMTLRPTNRDIVKIPAP